MTTHYSRCRRCDKFFPVCADTTLNLTVYDESIGNSVELCDDCFREFKDFILRFPKMENKNGL